MSLDVSIQVQRSSFTLDTSFSVAPGEIAVIVGPNGSGKSTLVSALCGLTPLASGTIKLNGRTLTHNRTTVAPRDRRIGAVFQDRLLFPRMTVLQNVAFGRRALGDSRKNAGRAAHHWLERLGIGALAARRASSLSGGEAQRVALARALACEPDLLVLDEPLSALDMQARPELRRLLGEILASFPGIKLVITHDPLEAMALADRLLVLESGTIAQIGTPEAIRQRPRGAYAASLVGVNLIRGVLRRDATRSLVVTEQGAELVTASTDLANDTPVFASVHPRAILLSRERPATSARNAFAGSVRAVDQLDGRVRVLMDAGPAWTAEITPTAAAELDLTLDTSIWVSFKATELTVYPR
ncbi:MAG: ABC transporter ATP-binding protein [Phycisphaerales bacterium]|nr:ABC transporter ATP-binding protein [Phycisphaerales bacterium]